MDENETPTPNEPIPDPVVEASIPLGGPSPAPRATVVMIALAVIAALIAGGTVLVVRSGSKGAELQTRVPTDAVAFARVSLSPTGSQRDALRDMLDRFPSEGRELASKLDEGLEGFFADLDLSYANDVKPWVGAQVGVALRLDTTTSKTQPEPLPVVLIQTKDDEAARTTLARIPKSFAGGSAGSSVVADGIAYVGKSTEQIEAFRADVTTRGALSENEAFTRHAVRLKDTLAFGWVDGGAITRSVGAAVPGLAGQAGTAGTFSFGLRVTGDGIDLLSFGLTDEAVKVKSGAPALLEATSAGLAGALSVFDVVGSLKGAGGLGFLGAAMGSGFSESFSSSALALPSGEVVADDEYPPVPVAPYPGLTTPPFKGGSPETVLPGRTSSPFDFNPLKQFGIDFEKDLAPWLQGEISVVVGGVSTPPIPDVGVLIESTDDAVAKRTLNKLKTSLGKTYGVTPLPNGFTVSTGPVTAVVRREVGRVIIASSQRYADALAKKAPDALAEDSVYNRTLGGSGQAASFQLFVRLDRIQGLLETFLPAESRADYERDVKPYLDQFQSFGIRASVVGRESSFLMRLTLRD